ncbi:MAG: sensor domain-containing diguanylate cyclase [Acidobacteriaceae bacterium]
MTAASTPDHNSRDGSRFVVEVFTELQTQTIQSRAKAINVLLRLSTLTGLHMQLQSTLNLLCDYAHEIAAYDSALVYLWDEQQDAYRLRVTRSYEADNSASAVSGPVAREAGNLLSIWATQYSQPMLLRISENAAATNLLKSMGAASCLMVPLFMTNRVMGSLQLFSRDPSAFSAQDAQLLWMLALVSENLLTREAANEGLMRFAFTDYLTGLRSRGYFEQQLELEIKRSERNQTTFALMMLDIDYFKNFNDAYGHPVGDLVLRDVSAILVRDMREVDTVARYGGEEFVIILPEAELHGALQVAERLRHSVEQAEFFAGEPSAPQQLTISIGIAVFGNDGRNRNQIIEAADSALYEAKSRGRNCIVTYSDPLQQHQIG